MNTQGIWLNPNGRWHAFQLKNINQPDGTTHEERANTDGGNTDEWLSAGWVKISVCMHTMCACAIDDKRFGEVQAIAEELGCRHIMWTSSMGSRSFLLRDGTWSAQ